MKPKIQTTPPELIKDVIATAQSVPAVAEPPKDMQFVEVSAEATSQPVTAVQPAEPPVVLGQTPTAAAPAAAEAQAVAAAPSKRQPAAKPASPKGPTVAVTLVVIIFVALAGVAYYAYAQTV